MEQHLPIDTPIRPDADLQFDSLLREAKEGKQHSQNWDTGDVASNVVGFILPIVVPIMFHKYSYFTLVAMTLMAYRGCRYVIGGEIKAERQTGLSLLIGCAFGVVAWVICHKFFGVQPLPANPNMGLQTSGV